MRRNTVTDWTVREAARATIRIAVKNILRKRGYPPPEREGAVALVMQQAVLWADQLAA